MWRPEKSLIILLSLSIVLASCQKAPSHEAFVWKPYSKQALEDAIAKKKPIVFYFWAQWCPNCRELDRTVFSDPFIMAKLAQVEALKMDVTDMDNAAVQQMSAAYAIDGVPTVVFLDRGGHEIDGSRIVGLVNSQEFAQSLAMLEKPR